MKIPRVCLLMFAAAAALMVSSCREDTSVQPNVLPPNGTGISSAGTQTATPAPDVPVAPITANDETVKEKTPAAESAARILLDALKLAKAGKGEEAEKILNDALKLAPEDPGILTAAAAISLTMKNYDEAETRLRAALALAPDDDNTRKMLGDVLYRQDDRHGALREWETVLARHDDAGLRARTAKVRAEMEVEDRLDERGTARFTLLYDGREAPEAGTEVLDMLETAFTRIASALRVFPDDTITVILYTNRDFRRLTGTYGWVAAIYDGKIKIPLRGYREHKREMHRLVRHELTHALVFRKTPACPAWLHEGLALYFEGADRKAAEKALAAEKEKIISFADMPAHFTDITNAKTVARHYRQSFSFVSYIVDTYGEAELPALLDAINEKKKVEEAFKEVFNTSLSELEREWKETLE